MRRGQPWPVLVIALALLVVTLGMLLANHLTTQLQAHRGAAWQSFRVADVARSVLAGAQEAEIGQRGYLLTGQPGYLQPFEAAQAQLPGALQQLQALVAGMPAQHQAVERLRELVEAQLGGLAEGLAACRGTAVPPGCAGAQAERGQAMLPAIRAAAEGLVAGQQAVLDARMQEADATEDRSLITALAGAVLALALLLAGGLLLLRSNGRLRAAEAALAGQGAMLQATLDHLQDGVAAFDGAGALVACNNRFFALLEFPQALALPGTPFAAFMAIDRRRDPRVLAAPDPSRSSGAGGHLAVSGAAPGGPAAGGLQLALSLGGRELEVYRSAMPDGGFVIACLDVTRRVQAEAVLRQSHTMEAIGQLTGGVARDFSNMLRVVTANLDLLAQELGAEHAGRRYLGHAVSAVARGARLTSQLLAFARCQPLDPRVVDPGRLVQELTGLLRRTLGEAVQVEATLAPGLWNIEVDPGQLEEALLNLALNARDAMPGGGRLTLGLSNAVLGEAVSEGQLEVEPGAYVLLAVGDNGSGMPPEVLARACEPFFTTKAEGSGLGLSQVYGFVKQSGGHVTIASTPGEGSLVRLYLPRSRRAVDF